MMKVIIVFKAFISEWETSTWPPSIQMGVTAGIFLASILLKEMRYLHGKNAEPVAQQD
jgi:hypothetical protein